MVIKTSNKTKASQRKGAISAWKVCTVFLDHNRLDLGDFNIDIPTIIQCMSFRF